MDIIYEDNHLIAVNKRAGDIVQPDPTGDLSLEEMLADHLIQKHNKPGRAFVGVIHRLDRPVSGLILFAKTSKALDRTNKLFRDRKVEKTYLAVVRTPPPKDRDSLQHWLLRDRKKMVTKAYGRAVKGSGFAQLDYEVLGELDGYYLLKINPLTGRTHQIRCQLAQIGSPIVGDNKYGYPRGSTRRSICLHSRSLCFVHPVRDEKLALRAPLPEDGFWERFERLGNYDA